MNIYTPNRHGARFEVMFLATCKSNIYIIFTYNCTEMSGAGSHRGEAHRLECWSPGLQPRIPPWCRPSRRRGRREVCPLPGSLRPRAAAGLCVCGGSAAGAHTHVEINSHLSDTENFYLHFFITLFLHILNPFNLGTCCLFYYLFLALTVKIYKYSI